MQASFIVHGLEAPCHEKSGQLSAVAALGTATRRGAEVVAAGGAEAAGGALAAYLSPAGASGGTAAFDPPQASVAPLRGGACFFIA